MNKYFKLFTMLIIILSLTSIISAADSNNTDKHQDTTISTEDTAEKQTINELSHDDTKSLNEEIIESSDEDCCSNVVQGYDNDSAISFRRDNLQTVTLNVKNDSNYVRQYKTGGSYYCHIIVSKNGWLMGNGGLDGGSLNQQVGDLTLEMFNKNTIIKSNVQKIVSTKRNSALGHYLLKAPNGTYTLFTNYHGRTYSESGVLSPGQFLVVPNSPQYFLKGNYEQYTGTSSVMTASRIIAAKNKYGIYRRQIITFYYKSNGVNSTVQVTASNDNGKYVGVRSSHLVDNIQTAARFIKNSQIPVIDNTMNVENVVFKLRKVKSKTITNNFVAKKDWVNLNATITDEFGKKVSAGYVTFKVNGKTLKYSNNAPIRVNVKNGMAQLNYKLPNMWKNHNYTYQAIYHGNSLINQSTSYKSWIFMDVAKMQIKHAKITTFGTNLTINVKVNYKSNNSAVDGGKIMLKVNGKTIKKDGKTLTLKVNKRTLKYNLKLDDEYSAKKYNITVVYINGAHRLEKTSDFTIHKIRTKLINTKISSNNRTISIKAKLTDKNNKTIKYNSYAIIKLNQNTLTYKNKRTIKYIITKGHVNINLSLPENYKKGKYTLTVVLPELRQTFSLRKNYTILLK